MGFVEGFKNFINFISAFPSTDELFGQRLEQAKSIHLRREYRKGSQRDMLQTVPGKPDDNVQVNIIGKAINQGMHLLLGKGVDFDLPGEEDDENQKWLDGCWEANNKQILLKDAYLNAADGRCGFIKINPTKTVVGIRGESLGEEYPALEVVDPLFVSMDANPVDMSQVIRYTITFVALGPTGKERLYKQEIEHQGAMYDEDGNVVDEGNYWLITDSHKDPYSGSEWIIDSQTKWDYEFAPMVHWKNLPNPNSLWGMEDATEDLINLQDKHNFAISNLNKIIRYNAHPKMVGKGIASDTGISVSPDGLIVLNSPDSDLSLLEMQSDMAGAVQLLDYIGKSIMDNMDAVNISNLKDKVGQITNFALRVLFYDALGKMEIKREIWEDWLLDLNYRLLVIGGKAPDPGQIVWPKAVLPLDDKEVIEVQKAELELGVVSKQTISVERGRDYEQENDRIDEEKAGEATLGESAITNFLKGKQ